MTNAVDFQKAKAARATSEAQKLAAVFANREAELRAALSVGFKFTLAGKDRWDDPICAVLHYGKVIIHGSAELGLDEALELVDELLDSGVLPAPYQEHAEGFVEVIAEQHADADAEIDAELSDE